MEELLITLSNGTQIRAQASYAASEPANKDITNPDALRKLKSLLTNNPGEVKESRIILISGR